MTELDKTDRAILAAVQRDGRLPIARLTDSVGLSETPCARRLKRLENDGYIERYRAQLSRQALGFGVVAFVLVRFATHDRKTADRFEREVLGIERIQRATTWRARPTICCRSWRVTSTTTARSCANRCGCCRA